MSRQFTRDWKIKHAIDVIENTYGDIVSVDLKKKDLLKFGRNTSVGTGDRFTIWYTGQDQPSETYPADNTNPIDSISGNTPSDVSIDLTVEGHTMSGGNRTFVSQTVTTSSTNARTRVALGTPLNRITRISNADSTDLQGEIYGYENTALTGGKPTDTTKIHITIPAGEQQSQKASTSLSSTDYWIVTGFSCGYLEKSGANTADVRLEVREVGGVWKPISKSLVMSVADDALRRFNPYIIIPKNADVRLTATASSTGQDIVGDIQGYLAQIVS